MSSSPSCPKDGWYYRGRGVLLGILGRGVPEGVPNGSPNLHPYSDLASLLRLGCQQKDFLKSSSNSNISLSFSLIWSWNNKNVHHSRSSLENQTHMAYVSEYPPLPPPPRDSTIHRLNRYQRKSIWEINCVLHWIEIYPVYSAIQPLNNWGLDVSWNCKITTCCPVTHLSIPTICPNKTKVLLPIKSLKTFFTYHNPNKINVIIVNITSFSPCGEYSRKLSFFSCKVMSCFHDLFYFYSRWSHAKSPPWSDRGCLLSNFSP